MQPIHIAEADLNGAKNGDLVQVYSSENCPKGQFGLRNFINSWEEYFF